MLFLLKVIDTVTSTIFLNLFFLKKYYFLKFICIRSIANRTQHDFLFLKKAKRYIVNSSRG